MCITEKKIFDLKNISTETYKNENKEENKKHNMQRQGTAHTAQLQMVQHVRPGNTREQIQDKFLMMTKKSSSLIPDIKLHHLS